MSGKEARSDSESRLQRSGCSQFAEVGSGRGKKEKRGKAATAAQHTVLLRQSGGEEQQEARENKAEEWVEVFTQVSRRQQSERAAPDPEAVPAEQAPASRGAACAANPQLFPAESFINASSCVFWHKSIPNFSPLLILSGFFLSGNMLAAILQTVSIPRTDLLNNSENF